MGCQSLGMRYATFLFLACTLAAHATAQDALEPCRDRFDDRYHKAVTRVIDKAVAKPARLMLATIPSFEPESGLRLVGNEIYHVEFPTSFWHESYPKGGTGRMDFTAPRIAGKVRRALLSADVANRVERVFVNAIARSRESDAAGLDGVSYVITTPDNLCGYAWSPRKGSRNAQLIQLMQRLEKHTSFTTPVDLQRSEQSLIRLLNALERD